MIGYRAMLATMFIILVIYTVAVVTNEGFGLVAVFFGDIANGGWRGQFNLDFLMLLILAGCWVAWRHGFSGIGIILGLCTIVGGVLFLSVYLFFMSFQTRNDARRFELDKRS